MVAEVVIAAQRLTVNAMVLGSIPIRGNKLLSFPRSGNQAKSGVVFCHSTQNFLKIVKCCIPHIAECLSGIQREAINIHN